MTFCLRGHDLDWRQIDDDIVALDGREAVYFAVHGAGTLLWRQLAGSTTRDRLVESLVQEYDIDQSRATTDVDRFLEALRERELLVA